MNLLVLGSGAREHALAWKLRQSPRVGDLFVAPGNPGTASLATNLPLNPVDFDAIAGAAKDRHIELVLVGPEDPLAAGVADHLSERGLLVYGPTRAAAQIEASKHFAKQLMACCHVPTARSAAFEDFEQAAAYVRSLTEPPVVKADGLAAGKGVTVAESQEEALDALRLALRERAFGKAGRKVVVEARLQGREVSAHAFVAGDTVLPMVYACDHKAAYDGGRGPNTGGMGAFSPPADVDPALHEQILARVVRPVAREMTALGIPYYGTLYPGLMLTRSGPQVLEFNCRFGDPETQVILPRLRSDLFEPVLGVATKKLDGVALDWSGEACVGVVLASGGYPGAYCRGVPIDGLDEVDADLLVFHAGTALDDSGRLVTAGGRVLTVVGLGLTLEAARRKVYDNIARIRFDGRHYRTDIGL
jgi:phosphoribosylamine---glycine ligase